MFYWPTQSLLMLLRKAMPSRPRHPERWLSVLGRACLPVLDVLRLLYICTFVQSVLLAAWFRRNNFSTGELELQRHSCLGYTETINQGTLEIFPCCG